MEGSITLLILVILGFLLALYIGRLKQKHDRIVNWVSLSALVIGSVWLIALIANGAETGFFITLLAAIYAGGAVKIGWDIWSDRGKTRHNTS